MQLSSNNMNREETMDLAEKEENYEDLRQKNLDDNKAWLRENLGGIKLPGIASPKRAYQKRVSDGGATRRNPTRTARAMPYPREPPVTRSGGQRMSVASDTSSSQSTNTTDDQEGTLRIKFASFQFKRSDERRKRAAPSAGSRTPDDITEEELAMVSQRVSDKQYDAYYGSSCHQCRQKTLDMKTICRSESCVGIRGAFCGPCLKNRYGEDARQCLKDPDWECPPCRGVCNCSICRRRMGKSATGQLIRLAHAQGYSDVCSYLESLKR